MDELKELFGGVALTYEQFSEKVAAGKLKLVNIADGSYVSKSKMDDRTGAQKQQIDDLTEQLKQRDDDLKDLQGKLEAAQIDVNKLAEAQNSLAALQQKYDSDTQANEQKLKDQAYGFAIREKSAGLKFTSSAAKRDFERHLGDKKLQMEGDTMLGYDDVLAKYKADNPGAIEEEKDGDGNGAPAGNGGGTPQVVLPTGNSGGAPAGKSLFSFNFNGVRPAPQNEAK